MYIYLILIGILLALYLFRAPKEQLFMMQENHGIYSACNKTMKNFIEKSFRSAYGKFDTKTLCSVPPDSRTFEYKIIDPPHTSPIKYTWGAQVTIPQDLVSTHLTPESAYNAIKYNTDSRGWDSNGNLVNLDDIPVVFK